MGRYLCIVFLVAFIGVNLSATKVKGPRNSFKNMFNFLKIKKKPITGTLQHAGKIQRNLIEGRGLFRKPKLPGMKDRNELKVSKHIGFPFKASHQLLLMRSKSLVAEYCKTLSYNRTIRSEGCMPKTIQMKHCTGRCNSFFVPLGHRSFRFCSHCLPIKSKATSITLECPGAPKKVQIKPLWIIEKCACQSVKSCAV